MSTRAVTCKRRSPGCPRLRTHRPSGAVRRWLLLALVTLACAGGSPAGDASDLRVDPDRVAAIQSALGPLIAAGAEDGSSLTIGLDEVLGALDPDSRRFLETVQRSAGVDVPPGPATGVALVRLEDQQVGETSLPVQLLPRPVYEAYRGMSAAMEAELGTHLRVGSGYRSHGYQLFVFASYLPVADYSLRETLRHVSLPSEHSQPDRQGIDFVSEAGVDIAYADPEAFRALPEFAWLVAHASGFGFAPLPDEEAASSPWHWHWTRGTRN